MQATINHEGKTYTANLNEPLDISLCIGTPGPRAWYVGNPTIEPVIAENFVGSVAAGSSVNFFNVAFNPHGHGTHTECLGHVTLAKEQLSDCLKQFFFTARLISVNPELATGNEEEQVEAGDLIITAKLLEELAGDFSEKTLVIRTLPNTNAKKTLDYSNTNPAYLTPSAAQWLVDNSVEHLLLDLPSVDRENDEGRLSTHKTFWQLPDNPQMHKTITEMIFVPNEIPDGLYLLNLQVANFANDAVPSRPILFALK